eukprot:CAMPEP_0169283348 /NCGR_PEP_ID=MMETSP1016-20121227/57494_1 /TAXON_ID=342587 /ORGANISM="Karlodinium micrum, Strain CCMP2283" /LENGTH=209 /DNA_ID=CAMNT_0009372537 /DNA_START=256 /DNA_END=885 /DNA_ORIENTATION=+
MPTSYLQSAWGHYGIRLHYSCPKNHHQKQTSNHRLRLFWKMCQGVLHNPTAVTDPWTKGAHRGISHMYLGQRGATKLAAKGGVEVPANQKYPHKDMCTIKHENHANVLKLIQAAMKDEAKKEKVKLIYETVGVYLGYALAQYMEFYTIDHVMILGRVSKGDGGDLVLDTAKKVLQEEFPDLTVPTFHTADDHFKAVGQCIAAAALPTIK